MLFQVNSVHQVKVSYFRKWRQRENIAGYVKRESHVSPGTFLHHLLSLWVSFTLGPKPNPTSRLQRPEGKVAKKMLKFQNRILRSMATVLRRKMYFEVWAWKAKVLSKRRISDLTCLTFLLWSTNI